jgi:hypothetical protein
VRRVCAVCSTRVCVCVGCGGGGRQQQTARAQHSSCLT